MACLWSPGWLIAALMTPCLRERQEKKKNLKKSLTNKTAINANSVWKSQDDFFKTRGDTKRSLVSNAVLYLSRSESSVILCHKETFPAASA